MTLEEAKELLTKDRNDHHSFTTDIIGQAEQIGIEAIEAILIWRDDGEGDDLTRLFSETFD